MLYNYIAYYMQMTAVVGDIWSESCGNVAVISQNCMAMMNLRELADCGNCCNRNIAKSWRVWLITDPVTNIDHLSDRRLTAIKICVA